MQKKREKAEAKAATNKKRKLADGSAAPVNDKDKSAKRQNSVWVGNLNFKTTPEALTTFFKDAGEVTRVNMPHKPTTGKGAKPENKGYAYVDFASVDAKTIAITMSEQNLLGRKLLIKDGDDFAGRPTSTSGDAAVAAATATAGVTGLTKSAQRILRAQKQPPAPTLFLGNLPFETTDETIRDLFEAHRKSAKRKDEADDETAEKPKEWIRKIRMGTFEDSGLCKGFAFVDFVTTEDATTALVNPRNHHLNGRELKVEYASADAVRRGQPKERGVDSGGSRPPRHNKEGKRTGPRPERPSKREHVEPTAVKAKSEEAHERPAHTSLKKEFKGKEERGDRDRKGPKNRPRPGAALAEAKRESAAIVPAQGKKIMF
uniref:RRM domain-containing protein n=1 Tax=Mycena chlorophos TaxID=658473 RepID=A0ABQ0M589_MYCCL|nr:predicted protein [Mycena chlorophos]